MKYKCEDGKMDNDDNKIDGGSIIYHKLLEYCLCDNNMKGVLLNEIVHLVDEV